MPRFLRPFQGVPAPLPLSGLFLFAPAVSMKLAGQPMRQAFADMGKESLYKRSQLEPRDEAAGLALLSELAAILPDGAPAADLIRKTASGDPQARAQLEAKGLWEVFLHLKATSTGLSPVDESVLAIERACKEPHRLVHQGRCAEAAAMLQADPLMRSFLWPDALAIISAARRPEQLRPLQLAVALEIQLSLLALTDASDPPEEGGDTSSFSCLVPPAQGAACNPTSLLFRWLKAAAGAASIGDLLRRAPAQIDPTTLKRWSSGAHQPSETWLRALSQHLFGDPGHAPL